MIRFSCFVMFIACTYLVSLGQGESHEVIQINGENICVADLTNSEHDNFINFSKVVSAIGTSDIVVISESDHGDYSAIRSRKLLMEYLHEFCGFNVLITEYSFFPMEFVVNKYGEKDMFCNYRKITPENYYWEYLPELFNWVDRLGFNGENPFRLSGCDIGYYKYNIEVIDSAIKLINKELLESKKYKWFTDYYLTLKQEPFNQKKKEEKVFCQYCDYLIDFFRMNDPNSIDIQYLRNIKATVMYYFLSKNLNNIRSTRMMNLREKQMAENIIWLIEHKFKGQKIIVSISSFHSMRNLSSISSKQIQKRYSVGQYLWNYFGDRIYSIACIGYNGRTGRAIDSYNIIDGKRQMYVESQFHNAGYKQAFVDFRSLSNNDPFYMDALYNLPNYQFAVWNEVFDGIIFNDSIYPAFIVPKEMDTCK
ncbi:MAG: hypothetical protein CVU11_16560 [Bacteroidetes bacterium HGW-Bacteroidetes-6]|jgi:erythromycin esterase|nr:MAG: hypothetical protein CVU11_16560 [Bacteroidetes bacterium HGW-Bacteroidetes-6]